MSEYDPPDASELGHWRADWPVVGAVIGGLLLGVMIFLAGGGCARGADLPAYQVSRPEVPAYQVSVETTETPAAGRGSVGQSVDAPPPVQTVLLGWWRWDGLGNVWYEPSRPTPPGAVTYPAPGVAAPARPFVPPPAPGATTPATTARFAAGPSTSSPAPGRWPGVTATLAPPAIRGGTRSDCPT